MAQRGIREYDGKRLLAEYLPEEFALQKRYVLISAVEKLDRLEEEYPWLRNERLVVKPDQLFGKRRKNKLILLNAGLEEAKKFIKEKMGKEVTIGKTHGELTHFLIEAYVKHEREYYLAIKSDRKGDRIYFSLKGGVDIEENWESVVEIHIDIIESASVDKIMKKIPDFEDKEITAMFTKALFDLYKKLGFAYLEINPFTVVSGKIIPIDLVGRIDDTSYWENSSKWGNLEFPAPFGRKLSTEEKYVKELDEKTGASLKLTVLNPKGRVWTLVAGGGASVIYADTVVDLGYGNELANYGEYSGNPKEDETYEYAKTILDLMTREKDPKGKILIIGGGIANFTDVANTFKGIIRALRDYQEKLRENNVKIFVRRGGPNYKTGLSLMKELGEEINVPMKVYGPELHMTEIVAIALKEY